MELESLPLNKHKVSIKTLLIYVSGKYQVVWETLYLVGLKYLERKIINSVIL